MKIIPHILITLVLSSVLFSCVRPDRAICSYALRNNVVERIPGKVDTVWANQFYSEYDRDNRSYFEAGKFNYNGDKKIIIASDIFIYPKRFSPYDKYEKVNYLILQENQVKDLLIIYENLHKPVDSKASNSILDYTINKDVFFTFNVSYVSKASGERLKINEIKWMYIWMNGRKHEVDAKKFFKAMKKEI